MFTLASPDVPWVHCQFETDYQITYQVTSYFLLDLEDKPARRRRVYNGVPTKWDILLPDRINMLNEWLSCYYNQEMSHAYLKRVCVIVRFLVSVIFLTLVWCIVMSRYIHLVSVQITLSCCKLPLRVILTHPLMADQWAANNKVCCNLCLAATSGDVGNVANLSEPQTGHRCSHTLVMRYQSKLWTGVESKQTKVSEGKWSMFMLHYAERGNVLL